jgi:hypothetical protein
MKSVLSSSIRKSMRPPLHTALAVMLATASVVSPQKQIPAISGKNIFGRPK